MEGYDEAAGYGQEKYSTPEAAATAKFEAQEHLKSMVGAIQARAHRSVRIYGEVDRSKIRGRTTSKVVHFIRHGQGYHNSAAYESKYRCDCEGEIAGQIRGLCPYLDPKLLDPRLTQLGRDQALALRKKALELSPELVCVSPLVRATETAVLGFPGLWGATPAEITGARDESVYGCAESKLAVPWIALRDLNEGSGMHICDKRRGVSELKMMFPFVDYSTLPEADDLWTPERETKLEIANRAYSFMCWLRERPEKEIIVATHSAFLLTMMNAVIECQEPSLEAWFATGEMRSVGITFEDREADGGAAGVEPPNKKTKA